MSRALIATLNQRLRPLGYETLYSKSSHRGPWMKFPSVEHRWTLRRTDAAQGSPEAPGAPVFVCHRVSLPTSSTSSKARELRTWARSCLAYAEKNKTTHQPILNRPKKLTGETK